MNYTQYDFNKLSNDEKLELVSYEGTFLDNRIFAEIGISLYEYNGFYVEVWLDRKENEIDRVITFTQLRYLEPYLEKINLNEMK